jgi:hypothetical protein
MAEPLPTIAAFLDDVPARQRAGVAILEVKARYTLWEADVCSARKEPN